MLGTLAFVFIPALLAPASDVECAETGLAEGEVISARVAIATQDGTLQDGTLQDGKVKIDAERIYYGSPNAWTRAAVIDGAAVLRATAAWKEMEKKGVRRGDPAYELYKNRAEKEARAAIERVARMQKPAYDLIGEIGSIVIKGGVVPNLTDDVVGELGS
jgi:hypothetical protein